MNGLWWRWGLFGFLTLGLLWGLMRVPPPNLKPGEGQVGKPMPEFRLQNMDGKWVSSDTFHERLKIITFWASWCEPCVVEMPSLQKLHERYADLGLSVIGINIEEEQSFGKILLFIKQNFITFSILRDPQSKVAHAFNAIRSIPHNFVVDHHGTIIYEERAPRDWANPKMTAWIETLLEHNHAH